MNAHKCEYCGRACPNEFCSDCLFYFDGLPDYQENEAADNNAVPRDYTIMAHASNR